MQGKDPQEERLTADDKILLVRRFVPPINPFRLRLAVLAPPAPPIKGEWSLTEDEFLEKEVHF